jgi:hypothetical protein
MGRCDVTKALRCEGGARDCGTCQHILGRKIVGGLYAGLAKEVKTDT